MDKSALVSIDVERGAEILRILDAAHLKVSVALWAVLAEYEDWRLILSGRAFDSPGPGGAYRLVRGALDAAGFPFAADIATLILPTSDPFVKQLRRYFGKTRSLEGMRLGGQLFGDRFVEDAYVYRIS